MMDDRFVEDGEREIKAIAKGSVEAETEAEAADALQLLHEQLGGFIYCERS
jgi:hypothetical protein